MCDYASVHACVLLCNSLPELCDGGGEVGGVGSHPKGFVLAVGVFNATICVPGLVALGPGQLWLKTLKYKKLMKSRSSVRVQFSLGTGFLLIAWQVISV